MKTNRIKWDESMAARCLYRHRNFAAGAFGKSEEKAAGRTAPETAGSVFDQQWADFEMALSRALKNK